MTHRVKCLGHSRGAERAKARAAAANRRAGLVHGSRIWSGGGATPTTASPGTVSIMANGSFYTNSTKLPDDRDPADYATEHNARIHGEVLR
jgi:hypothetical protein